MPIGQHVNGSAFRAGAGGGYAFFSSSLAFIAFFSSLFLLSASLFSMDFKSIADPVAAGPAHIANGFVMQPADPFGQ